MRIHKIERINYNLYEVFLTPDWIEKMFGIKPKTKTIYIKTIYIDYMAYDRLFDEHGNKVWRWSRIAIAIRRFEKKREKLYLVEEIKRNKKDAI